MSEANFPLRVRLYVAGDAPNSVAAVSNLRTVVAELPTDRVVVEVIDVVQNPERGPADGIFVTPMLVKVGPAPERRVLGNLRNRQLLRSTLGIEAALGIEPALGIEVRSS